MPSEARRNHTVDVVRAASVMIVVLFHALIYKASVHADGTISIGQWAPPKIVFLLSWPLMAMPAFFVCGGFANALIVDKMHVRGTGFAHYLANRGRRLTGGLTLFVTFFALLGTVVSWWRFDMAVTLSGQFMRLLWFISVYLVIVLFAPFLVRLHDRFGGWVLVVMLVGIVLVDRGVFAFGNHDLGQLNMFLVWPLCHQLGIGYQRGWFRRGPVWRTWAALLASAGGIAVLVFYFGYPASAVGFANAPVANHLPPTLAMALLGIAQAAVMGLVERSGVLDTLSERVEKWLSRLNALMMTVYLWHVPCLLIGAIGLLFLARLVPAAAPVLLWPGTIVVVGVAVMSVLVPAVGLVEFKLIPPLGERQDRDLALLSFLLMIAGSMLVWHNGTVLSLRTPGSTLGVVAIWAGAWLMVRASRPAGVAAAADDALKPRRRRTKKARAS